MLFTSVECGCASKSPCNNWNNNTVESFLPIEPIYSTKNATVSGLPGVITTGVR